MNSYQTVDFWIHDTSSNVATNFQSLFSGITMLQDANVTSGELYQYFLIYFGERYFAFPYTDTEGTTLAHSNTLNINAIGKAKILLAMHQAANTYKYKTLIASMNLEYNPIWNVDGTVDFTRTRTPNITHSIEGSNSNTETRDLTNQNYSSTVVDNDGTNNTTVDGSDDHSTTEHHTGTDTTTLTRNLTDKTEDRGIQTTTAKSEPNVTTTVEDSGTESTKVKREPNITVGTTNQITPYNGGEYEQSASNQHTTGGETTTTTVTPTNKKTTSSQSGSTTTTTTTDPGSSSTTVTHTGTDTTETTYDNTISSREFETTKNTTNNTTTIDETTTVNGGDTAKGTISNLGSDNRTEIESGTETYVEKTTRQGNIGVTTTQQMIKEERDIAVFDILKIYFDDISKLILLQVW